MHWIFTWDKMHLWPWISGIFPVPPEMHVVASCTVHTDIQTQTVTRWPTELQKTRELQTSLITDAISPHWLSLFLLQRHKSTHILKRRDTAITAMIWCTVMYISHPWRTQDNISLKRQISLQIKIPSSMSGHIQRMTNHKSRQLQDIQVNTDKTTILLFIYIW